MRIAMMTWESLHSVAVGGLGAHVTELAEALQRSGHEVHVITRMGPGQPKYSCIGGVHYHRCPVGPANDIVGYADQMCAAFVERLTEAEHFYGRRFDVIHGHDWLAARAIDAVKRNLGRRTVLTMHSSEYGRCGNVLHEGLSRAIRDVEWEGTVAADRVVCVSRALRDELGWLYSVPADKTRVIYNGVDIRRFDAEVDCQQVRERAGVGMDEPMVLFAGRLAQQKGPDLLLDAVPDVLRGTPEAKFVFAGDGDLRSMLEGKAAAAGLFGSVRFLGYRAGTELVGLFKAADTVCVPSRNEPFGIVVLEGWSAARPVVVTRSGGPAEFVRDRETGFTVSPDRESLSWGLGTALMDRDNARRIGRNGRHEAESRFSWDVIARQTEQVYEWAHQVTPPAEPRAEHLPAA